MIIKKKVLILTIIIFISSLLISRIIYNKWQIGYVKLGSDISVRNSFGRLAAFRLNDNEVFFLGSNRPEYIDYSVPVNETPSEIYNIENNTHEIVHLPTNIIYPPYGILLNDKKILLVNAAKIKTNLNDYIIQGHTDFSTYKTMFVVDLKTKEIIQTYDKKINKRYPANEEYTTYTLLNNGKVLIIDFKNKIAEIYNPDKNNSEILKFPYNKNRTNTVVPLRKNQALIFGQTENNYDYNDTVILYDDNTKTFKEFGQAMRRSNPYVIPIPDNKFLILGGTIHNEDNAQVYEVSEIEIFDGNIGSSNIVNELPYPIKYNYHNNINSFAVAPINENYILITGGYQGVTPFINYLKNSLIIDLKKNTISKGASLKFPLYGHQMLNMSDGKILIFDGVPYYNKRTQIYYLNNGGKL